MKHIILVLLTGLLFAGCSQAVMTPEDDASDFPRPGANEESNEWVWGSYTIAISEDLTAAELVPVRNSSLHLNVTKFVEGFPCPDCLKIGKPIPQGDGTFKLPVSLRHPFPNSPKYTGFDVRGVLLFKATDYFSVFHSEIWDHNKAVIMDELLLYYSDPAKGGAALLNADGYTFYLNLFLVFPDSPEIFNYYPGKNANGEPDCTVNPYILFSDGSHRRMFKTTDFMQREYHIKPPEGSGPFEFGYVVSACWAPPVNNPVTNPETDFPVEANCEDPWRLIIEQLQPINPDVADQPIFKVTYKHRPGTLPWCASIIVPTISTSSKFNPHHRYIRWHSAYDEPVLVDYIDDETTVIWMHISTECMSNIGDGLVPGWHLGIFISIGVNDEVSQPPSQLWNPIGVQPVMVYVEV